jgi:UPF0716 protein FxsA
MMVPALFLAFLVVPILEIYVIVQVGQEIGAWPTVLLLLLESALGAWIVRREGRRAWRALRDAVSQGQLPSRQLADGALLLLGGALLLAPGFITDFVGFLLVLPPTRALARAVLLTWLAHRAQSTAMGWMGAGPTGAPGMDPRAGRASPPTARGRGDVIAGEVIEPEPPEPRDR